MSLVSSASRVFDLAIVGAGPVGAALALALADTSLSLLLVGDVRRENTLGRLGFDLRAVTLNPGTQAFLSDIGVWSEIEQKSAPFTAVEAWDHEGSGAICFTAEEAGRAHLGHLVEGRYLEPLLLEKCRGHPVLTCVSGQVQSISLQPGQSLLQMADGSSYQARLVAGADGARSRVREAAAVKSRDWSYGQTALVSVLQVSHVHEGRAVQSFTESGPLALLPLPDAHHCVLIFSVENQLVESFLAMEDAAFAKALAQLSDHRFGEVLAVDRRIAIPLTRANADRYVADGVILLGDAAHRLHPLAGQGLNLGLRDARLAAQLLNRAAEVRLSVRDEDMLAAYDRARQADNLTFTWMVEAFRRGFVQPSPAGLVSRNWLLREAHRTPWLKKQFLNAALGHHFLAGWELQD